MTGLYPHQVGLQYNGRSLTRDGVTIAEALGASGYQTAMVGKWHLTKTTMYEPDQWELYDIAEDRTETTNVAVEHPEIVQDLSEQWNAWAERVGVVR